MTSQQSTPQWLDEAVFYQIYPQSFYDSNGDGIGDLPGIIEKLDYVRSLGVNAVWLNPCFDSPFRDAGYDVRDYRRVAPRYGANLDLKNLFEEARRRGIRVLLDLVPGHTSVEHPWFQSSCRHEKNEYSDWYIWTDSAWKWDVPGLRIVSGHAERDGAYVTNFFYFQPALNYGFARIDPNHPWQQPVDAPGPRRVREEIRNLMKFWLDQGASGFRVDMSGWLVKSDPDYKANIELWQEMRSWFDQEYPEAVLVAEWGRPAIAIEAGFHVDLMLPFGMPGYTSLLRKPNGQGPGSDRYGFSFFDSGGRGNIREFLDDYTSHYEKTKERGLIAPNTGNHDTVPRLSEGRSWDDLEVVFIWLLSMPGTPFLYYGDEIGMRTIHGLPSKEGAYGRTGLRTPMQWSEGPNAGFSSAPSEALYLPVDKAPDRPTVAAQERDPASLLNRVRRLIALRKAHPALCATGGFEVVYAEAGKYPFVFKRTKGDQTLLVAVNPSARPVEVSLPLTVTAQPRTLYGLADALSTTGLLRLPGVSGGVYELEA